MTNETSGEMCRTFYIAIVAVNVNSSRWSRHDHQHWLGRQSLFRPNTVMFISDASQSYLSPVDFLPFDEHGHRLKRDVDKGGRQHFVLSIVERLFSKVIDQTAFRHCRHALSLSKCRPNINYAFLTADVQLVWNGIKPVRVNECNDGSLLK